MGLTQTCQSQSSTHTFDTSIDTSVGYSDRKRFPSNTYQIWVLSKICFLREHHKEYVYNTSNMGITYSADHPKYTGS